MNQPSSMNLFAADDAAAARMDAIDQLHGATAIYTADCVVEQLLNRLRWPSGKRRLVDPSCGDGAFLAQALAKVLSRHAPTDDELLDVIEGWEIHPHACAQARARVARLLVGSGRSMSCALSVAERMVHNRDFLTDGPTKPSWHAIAGNPPYLRWLNVPKVLRDDYADHVPNYAASDMLHSFLDRCARALHDDGEIAMVTSDRWLFNLGASKLRAALGQRLSIQHLERLNAATAFYRPKQRRAGSPPRIHPVSVVLSREGGQSLTHAAIYPGASTTRYQGIPTLQELATVRIAPWLGTAGIFVVTAAQAQESMLPAEVLVPAIDTDDIVRGHLGEPSRFAIRTQPDTQPCAAVQQHLDRQMAGMAPRGRQGKPWMPPESFHRMDLSQPSLLVPRIAKTPSAVWVPAGYVPINHNLSIVCGDLDLLTKIKLALTGELAATWVREHAAPLENGYFSLTTTLLRKLPIQLG